MVKNSVFLCVFTDRKSNIQEMIKYLESNYSEKARKEIKDLLKMTDSVIFKINFRSFRRHKKKKMQQMQHKKKKIS